MARPAPARGQNLVQVDRRLAIISDFVKREVRADQKGGEDIVEVVCDATREQAQALEALTLLDANPQALGLAQLVDLIREAGDVLKYEERVVPAVPLDPRHRSMVQAGPIAECLRQLLDGRNLRHGHLHLGPYISAGGAGRYLRLCRAQKLKYRVGAA